MTSPPRVICIFCSIFVLDICFLSSTASSCSSKTTSLNNQILLLPAYYPPTLVRFLYFLSYLVPSARISTSTMHPTYSSPINISPPTHPTSVPLQLSTMRSLRLATTAIAQTKTPTTVEMLVVVAPFPPWHATLPLPSVVIPSYHSRRKSNFDLLFFVPLPPH